MDACSGFVGDDRIWIAFVTFQVTLLQRPLNSLVTLKLRKWFTAISLGPDEDDSNSLLFSSRHIKHFAIKAN
jgi:hypothetical protein